MLIGQDLAPETMMLRSFTVENFRGFGALTVEPLGRVNVIAGRNGVGKTSLLEALFLHAGYFNPELPIRVNAMRGLEPWPGQADEIWGWLFPDKRSDAPITLRGSYVAGNTTTLTIRAREEAPATLEQVPAQQESSVTTAPTRSTAAAELALEYRDSDGGTSLAELLVTPTGIKLKAGSNVIGLRATFLGAQRAGWKEDAERFSRLLEAKRENEVLDAVRVVEPRLVQIAVLVRADQLITYCDIGIGRMLPMSLVGAGTSRILSIILAVLSTPRGLLLVDEIENGVHHTVLEPFWRALDVASRRSDTQVIVTTHSWDAIRAAEQAFADSEPGVLAVHRLERREKQVDVITYDPETLTAAVRGEIEVR
jgi:hypothetical protein